MRMGSGEMDDADAGAVAAPSVDRSAAADTSPVNGGGREPPVPFSTALIRRIARRVAAGESVEAICAEPGMPHRATLARWTKTRPKLAELLRRAKASAGRGARSAQLSTYDPVAADEICERIAEGETLSAICRDPMMPGYSSVQRWRRTFGDFDKAFRGARQAMADRVVDESVEIVRAMPQDSAQALHVRLNHLRWTAGVWAPEAYNVRRVGPPQAPPPPKPTETPRVTNIEMRFFKVEMRESDGAMRVVGYRPNSKTGQVEQEQPLGEWSACPPSPGACWIRQDTGRPAWPPETPAEVSPEDEQWL